jgi:hypothetical protein
VIRCCEYCKNEFESKSLRIRFCSRKCMPSQRTKTFSLVCENCGVIRAIQSYPHKIEQYHRLCNDCAMDERSGAGSSQWKGGHKHWSHGRFGKDKDGLSWKIQRRLAWERDNYECQHCHEKKSRKPDVHHILPFKISQSHSLNNLVCLCHKCHMVEEAKCF